MFPLRDDNPTLHTSVITFLIIALNVAIWIFVQGAGMNESFVKSLCSYGLVPGELTGHLQAGARVLIGANVSCVSDGKPAPFTIISSMFMHGGWLHLIGNMWFLAIFGDNIEDVMGRFRFIIFYLCCGIAAAIAQTISSPLSNVPMIGASGAIGGVMGAYALLFPRAPVHMLVFLGFYVTRIVVPAAFMLVYWFGLQFLGGFFSLGASAGGTAFWAHIGGFLTGIILIKFFCLTGRLEQCRKRRGKTNRMVYRVR
ncbi:MAG: rhomboid family intramembrane serine protease [Chitinivibrionales bacterium]|nr:rhomboid family intramembrane serine protease [Chitinivibrionales bacterium]